MRANIAIVAATAMLLGTTAFAAAQNDTYHKSKTRHLQHAAPQRTFRPDAGNYNNYGWNSPGPGLYNYAPGPGGYYDRDYWNGVWNVAPAFGTGPSPYRGTPFYNVAPY